MASIRQGELYEPSGLSFFYKRRYMGPRAWSRTKHCKVDYTTLMKRLSKGWDFADAMETPPGENNPALKRNKLCRS